MTKFSLYKCDICGTTHEEEADARQCENSHSNVATVKSMSYRGWDKYPFSVAIEFGDGETKLYRRN